MPELVRYHGFIASSDRWDGFAFRDDDIVISTPPKSGTTWMQTLIALLLFDGVPDEPVYELSPWLDMNLRTAEEAHAMLAAQTHRRFIKTHTPLDGLPWDDRVTYLTVGRDPRDTFVSMLHHGDNLDSDRAMALRVAAVGDDDLEELRASLEDSDDPRDQVRFFLERDRGRDSASIRLAHVMHHLRLAWERRHLPNVHLFHYADLKADLPGQVHRLAGVLGIDCSPGHAAELADLATLEAMRERAGRTTPEASMGVFSDPERFFRRGGHGDGAAMMTEQELARYDQRVAELAGDAELATWIHGGWSAIGS